VLHGDTQILAVRASILRVAVADGRVPVALVAACDNVVEKVHWIAGRAARRVLATTLEWTP